VPYVLGRKQQQPLELASTKAAANKRENLIAVLVELEPLAQLSAAHPWRAEPPPARQPYGKPQLRVKGK
jgi:hypothetical protein